MIKKLCVLLIFCQINFFGIPAFSSAQSIEMQILVIKGNSIVSNKGSSQGILKDTEFQIVRRNGFDEEILGTAKVIITKQNKSGLKILSLRKGKTIKEGDWLIELTETEDDILSILDESNSSNQYKQKAEDLEKELNEKKVKESQSSGILIGVAICCGIVILLNLGAAAGSNQ